MQIVKEVHTPWKLGVLLVLLVVLGAGVGFWWFVSKSANEHEARIAAIDRQSVLGLFDTAFYAGDLDRAITQALIISEVYPTDTIGSVYSATAHLQAAMMRFNEQERLPVIASELERVRAQGTHEAEVLRLLGYTYILQGREDEAIKVFTDAIELDSTSALVRAGRGYAYLTFKRFEEAQADFDAALAQDSSQATALLGSAEVLLYTEGDTQAIESYIDKVFAATSNRVLYARALAILGVHQYTKAKYDKALTTFYDALEYDPQQYDAQLGVLMSELALAVTASLPHQSAIDAMDDTANAVESLYSGSAQLAQARGLLAALTNAQRERRAAYDQALQLVTSDRTLSRSDAALLKESLTGALNSTELFVPELFLSTRTPLEHCVSCGK